MRETNKRRQPIEPQYEKYSLLGKRNKELETELESSKRLVMDLRKDNDRLQKSMAHWHKKYQDLVASEEKIVTVWATPKKRKADDYFEFID